MSKRHVKEATMAFEKEQVKGVTKGAKRGVKEGVAEKGPDFDQPLGSSKNDTADLRQVAREAAEKSK